MAINLWKLGGKPTSYNPLPTGYTNGVVLKPNDYLISFRAKSPSSTTLRITAEYTSNIKNLDNNVVGGINFQLSSDFKTITLLFNTNIMQNIYLYDLNSKGDIIIDSIELVQKPLPKLTNKQYLWSDGQLHINKQAKRNAKSRTGLSFNGTTDYLQLPSMTMDSVEIECLIDSVQPNGGNNIYLFDCRGGFSTFVGATGTQGVNSLSVDGSNVSNVLDSYNAIPKGKRVKIKANFNQLTDDVTIFNIFDKVTYPNRNIKGILYKVTCYLNGNIVAQYDFENPKNIIGNQVIPNAKNLIPSFEDSRWNIHANAKVIGKDVLHADYTSSLGQGNDIIINVTPNSIIMYNCVFGVNSNHRMRIVDVDTSAFISNNSLNSPFNIGNRTKVLVRLEANGGIGSFDFIKPQLYALDGNQATINGSPIAQNKAAKRQLYAKR